MFRLSLFVPFILIACSVPTTSSTLSSESLSHLTPHDVSILMPYIERPELLKLSPVLSQQMQLGDTGFLPPGVHEHMEERLNRGRASSSDEINETLNDFKIASIRIDPCFNLVMTQGKKEFCAAQFRIVWQDMEINNGVVRGLDANIHAVYSLSQVELAAIITELNTLRKASGHPYQQEPLGPHPVIAKEGNGPFYQGLMRLVATYAIPSNLSFFAFLAEVDFNEWRMTAFQVRNGEILKDPLPNFAPFEDGSPVLHTQLFASHGGLLNSPEETATTIPSIYEKPSTGPLDHVLQIENPLSHDISNADCGSCHFARIERRIIIARAKRNGETIPPDVSEVSGSYPDKRWNRERREDFSNNPASLQMFSFFMNEYAVSQRTINETAEVMNWIEKNLPYP